MVTACSKRRRRARQRRPLVRRGGVRWAIEPIRTGAVVEAFCSGTSHRLGSCQFIRRAQQLCFGVIHDMICMAVEVITKGTCYCTEYKHLQSCTINSHALVLWGTGGYIQSTPYSMESIHSGREAMIDLSTVAPYGLPEHIVNSSRLPWK